MASSTSSRVNKRTFIFISTLITFCCIIMMSGKVVCAADSTSSESSSLGSSAALMLFRSMAENMDMKTIGSLASAAMNDHNIRKRAVDLVVDHIKPHVNTTALFSGRLAVSSVLATVTLYSAFKFTVVVLGVFYAVQTFFPALFGFFGIPIMGPTFGFRSVKDVLKDVNEINYNIVARSIDTVSRKSFFLDIQGPECSDRAVCEIGSILETSFPSVTYWIKGLGAFDKLILGDQYSLALMKGMKGFKHCSETYRACPKSPFSTWKDIYHKLR